VVGKKGKRETLSLMLLINLKTSLYFILCYSRWFFWQI